MEEKNKVEQLLGNLKEYAATQYDITVLNMQEKVFDILSSIASMAIVGVFAMLILFFGSVGAAWWLGQLFHNTSIGFFSIAGFYLVIALIVYSNRNKWIKLPIINALLKKINVHEED